MESLDWWFVNFASAWRTRWSSGVSEGVDVLAAFGKGMVVVGCKTVDCAFTDPWLPDSVVVGVKETRKAALSVDVSMVAREVFCVSFLACSSSLCVS